MSLYAPLIFNGNHTFNNSSININLCVTIMLYTVLPFMEKKVCDLLCKYKQLISYLYLYSFLNCTIIIRI